MKRLIIEPEAEADLLQVYRWYEVQRVGLGDEFLICFETAIAEISERPTSFPLVSVQTRRALISRFPYLILFVPMDDVVAVVGIFHGHRDPEAWATRLV